MVHRHAGSNNRYNTCIIIIIKPFTSPSLSLLSLLYLFSSLFLLFPQYLALSSDNPPSPYSLYIGLLEHLYPFLQRLALFIKCLTGTEFIHSSGTHTRLHYSNAHVMLFFVSFIVLFVFSLYIASMASNFTDLCAYLNLPHPLSSLFAKPAVIKLCQKSVRDYYE